MIKSLVKLGLFLVVGILIYNFFLGTPEEKATSKKIFSEIKDVGKSVGQLIKQEKEKFDAGKYDNALDKIGNAFDGLKEKAKEGGEYLSQIKDLEKRKDELKEKLAEFSEEGTEPDQKEQDKIHKEMEDLTKEMEDLADKMEKEE